MRLIKRYPNRKFYDSGGKTYVSLAGIASLVRAGEEIQVVDTRDGGDITTLVLSQILRQEEKRESFLSRSLLSTLIRRSSSGLRQLRNSFQASLHALRALEDEVHENIDRLVDRGEISLEDAQQLREELLARARHTQAALEGRILKEIETSLIRLRVPNQEDVEALNRQLRDIETKVDRLLSDPGVDRS